MALREEYRLRVVERRVLRIYGKKECSDWSCRGRNDVELHNLYSSLGVTRIIKTTRMGLAGNVVRLGEKECIQVIGGKDRRKQAARKTRTSMQV
jgi:hypothetical protein